MSIDQVNDKLQCMRCVASVTRMSHCGIPLPIAHSLDYVFIATNRRLGYLISSRCRLKFGIQLIYNALIVAGRPLTATIIDCLESYWLIAQWPLDLGTLLRAYKYISIRSTLAPLPRISKLGIIRLIRIFRLLASEEPPAINSTNLPN